MIWWWHWLRLRIGLWKARNIAARIVSRSRGGASRRALDATGAEAAAALSGRERGKYKDLADRLHGDYQVLVKASRPLYVLEIVEAFAVALVMALLIRANIVQAFQIPSGSMIPTLEVGDHILANKFLYRFRDPRRGDIVVFRFPLDDKTDFIKRIIAIPGDTVEVRGRTVLVNGKPTEEPYAVFEDIPDDQRPPYGPVTVPAGSYFMMGDNRDKSNDSRYWAELQSGKYVPRPFVGRDRLKGKAMIIYWSWDKEKDLLHKIRWSRMAQIVR